MTCWYYRIFSTDWIERQAPSGTVAPWTSPRLIKQKKHNNTLLFKVQPTDVGAMLEYDSQAAWERVRDEIVAKLLPSK